MWAQPAQGSGRKYTAGEEGEEKMERGRTDGRERRAEREKRWQKRKTTSRWWRFKATEVYFNGLFCIPLVAAGFWKTLHTVTISLAKGQTQQQQQCLAADHTSHYVDRFSGQPPPPCSKLFQHAVKTVDEFWKPNAAEVRSLSPDTGRTRTSVQL